MSSPPPSVTLPPHGAPRIPQGMTFHAADASSTDVQEHAGVPAPWRDPAKSSFRFGGFEKRQPLTPDDMSSTLGLSELTSREPHYPDDSSAGVSAPTSQATTVNESSDKMERLEYFHPKAVQAVVDARRRFALHTSRNWRTETDLAYDIRVLKEQHANIAVEAASVVHEAFKVLLNPTEESLKSYDTRALEMYEKQTSDACKASGYTIDVYGQSITIRNSFYARLAPFVSEASAKWESMIRLTGSLRGCLLNLVLDDKERKMLNQPPMQAPTEPAKSLPMYPYADSSHPKYGEFLSTARDILTEGKPIITRHKVLHDAWMAKGRKVPALLPTKELAAKAEAHKMFASDMDWICFQSEEGDRAGEDSVTDRLLKRIDTTLAGLGEETAKSE